MNTKYYTLLLDDPGKPGFCSFDKPYFGSADNMRMAVGLLRDREGYEDTVNGIENYLNGQRNAEHRVAYRSVPVLTEVEWISEAKLSIGEKTWTHKNIWGCPYVMRCDGALLMQVILKYENKYCRCLRAWFDNLRYEGPTGSWNRIDSFWGHRYLMLNYKLPGDNYKLNNILYLLDKEYATLEEAVDSLTKPEELCFYSFCDEIFADG